MAELLYYDDPNQFEFDAEVVSAAESKKGWEVVLNRTCFYPEGGGQPADAGTIAGIDVIDVQKRDGEITHVLKTNPGAGSVHGILDAARRLDYMQQHTGQHIISAALIDVGNFATVSVHQGEEYTTIEIDASDMSDADLRRIEDQSNEIIGKNLPVRTHWVSDEELPNYPLRRPSKVSGKIRLVEIESTDWVACGGVHTSQTGQVGLVKAVSVETIRGHIRISWKIGRRAYNDYALKDSIVSELVSRFSARPNEIAEKVDQTLASVRDAEFRVKQLSEKIATYEMKRLVAEAGVEKIVTAQYVDEDKDFLRLVMNLLMEQEGMKACLANVVDGKVQWSVGSDSIDFNACRTELLSAIDGKGGGKPPVWQGIGTQPDGIPAMFDIFKKI